MTATLRKTNFGRGILRGGLTLGFLVLVPSLTSTGPDDFSRGFDSGYRKAIERAVKERYGDSFGRTYDDHVIATRFIGGEGVDNCAIYEHSMEASCIEYRYRNGERVKVGERKERVTEDELRFMKERLRESEAK